MRFVIKYVMGNNFYFFFKSLLYISTKNPNPSRITHNLPTKSQSIDISSSPFPQYTILLLVDPDQRHRQTHEYRISSP